MFTPFCYTILNTIKQMFCAPFYTEQLLMHAHTLISSILASSSRILDCEYEMNSISVRFV